MSTFTSFAKKAIRPVLIGTVIGTTPALILLAFGMFSSPDPRDPDPDLVVFIPLYLSFFSAIASFALASIIALVWYFIRRAWQQRELRRIGERFGRTPQTK